jgi:hypothetical protein
MFIFLFVSLGNFNVSFQFVEVCICQVNLLVHLVSHLFVSHLKPSSMHIPSAFLSKFDVLHLSLEALYYLLQLASWVSSVVSVIWKEMKV